jgi:hypothetical protein
MSSTPKKSRVQTPTYNDFLLKARLKRVSQELLEKFIIESTDLGDTPKNKDNLAEQIVNHYKIMKNNKDFSLAFGNFVRDYVLSAGESEYLIEVTDKEGFIKWINGWSNNIFTGAKFDFYKNVHLEFGEKYLGIKKSQNEKPGEEKTEILSSSKDIEKDTQSLSFPSSAFLLVAYNKIPKSVFSKDDLVEIYETHEFEIIFRKDSPLVGVRGNLRVVRDFFTSVIEDPGNSLSMVNSLFIGNFDKKTSRPIGKPRRSIDIEKLRMVLDGTYLDIDAPMPGDQATRVKVSLKGMRKPSEETHPMLGPLVNEALKEQEKSRIGFRYNGSIHTFSVTKNGGLYFRQFAPEEAITYVLLKISTI